MRSVFCFRLNLFRLEADRGLRRKEFLWKVEIWWRHGDFKSLLRLLQRLRLKHWAKSSNRLLSKSCKSAVAVAKSCPFRSTEFVSPLRWDCHCVWLHAFEYWESLFKPKIFSTRSMTSILLRCANGFKKESCKVAFARSKIKVARSLRVEYFWIR